LEDTYRSVDDLEEYDPLGDDENLEDQNEVHVIGKTDIYDKVEGECIEDSRTPRQKFEDLIDVMKPQKNILLGLIDACREPQTAAAVDERLKELTQYQYCVFDGVELRRLLQEAEALEYLEPNSEELAAEAQTEVGEDGQEYLVIQKRQEGRWQAAPAALEVVDEQDANGDFHRLLAKEPRYLDIYKTILDYCRLPRTIKEIDALVNESPLLQEPRRYGGYFIERLEKNGGLAWKGNWVSTALGVSLLDQEKM